MKKYLAAALLAGWTLGWACGNTCAAEANAKNGAALFKKNCNVCHKNEGSKSSMSREIKGATLEQVQNSIRGTSGGLNAKYKFMVNAMKKKKFSDQDITDIAAFLRNAK